MKLSALPEASYRKTQKYHVDLKKHKSSFHLRSVQVTVTEKLNGLTAVSFKFRSHRTNTNGNKTNTNAVF